MRQLLVAALLFAGCGPKDASSTGPTTPDVANVKVVGADPGGEIADADGTIKPEATAGLYWLPYGTCYECSPPAAVVAYITPDAAVAKAITSALAPKLRLGLPYVVHTDEIGATPRGVAVVTGSFSTREAAAAAAGASSEVAGVKPAVLSVASDYWSEAPRRVTVIDRGPPVPAWSAADLRAVEDALNESDDPDAQNTMESQLRWMTEKLEARKPACTVAPGDLFVVEDSEMQWYSFAPVRCGTTAAYVPWTRTLLGHAVILRADDGSHTLLQVVGAECDRPIIESWRYDENGRHEPEPDRAGDPLVARGGC